MVNFVLVSCVDCKLNFLIKASKLLFALLSSCRVF